MRPALLAAIAPLAIAGLFAIELVGGTPEDVRQEAARWLPGALALVGCLGPVLLARGSLARAQARAFVLAGLAGLVTLGALVMLIPLAAGETPESRWYPAFDVVLAGALVSLAALGVRRVWAFATLVVAAVAIGRAAGSAASSASVGVHVGLTFTGALFLASAAMLAAALAALRFRRSARRPIRA